MGTVVFAKCSEITDVFCYAVSVPNTYGDTFRDSYIEYATLYVPDASIDLYKKTAPWSEFKEIVGLSEAQLSISIIKPDVDNKNNLYYSLKGVGSKNPHKGINIRRTDNGVTQKVIIR